jgi:hypothetical protein
LLVADRDERRARERGEGRVEPREIETAVERVHARRAGQTPEQKRGKVDVTVDDVELGEPVRDGAELGDVREERIGALGVEAQSARHARHQAPRRARVAGGEERHRVAAAHQLLGEPRHHPFGAAVQMRRDALVKGCDLSDAHQAPRKRAKRMPVRRP